jgi:Uma2 family endonuclease
MSVATAPRPSELDTAALPSLREGERLTQPEFHARYLAMPEDARAELINGVVSMASPLSQTHVSSDAIALRWLFAYEDATPGVVVHANATVIFGEEGEVQPDAYLRVLSEYGGRCQLDGEYIRGAPELIIEIAVTTEAKDLGEKYAAYERAGVLEYVVQLPRQRSVLWFASVNGRFEALPLDEDGLYRSRCFPGLWLDPAALLGGDIARVREIIATGIATPDHATFVRSLQQERAAAG